MAEIILPPEENEETPQTPELNIDKPTENSKVITIEFEAKKTNKVSTKDTNQQLYTTDTDAWFEFKETSLESANGTYSVVFRNRHDGSIFQRTGDVVGGVTYYKIPHQEIRHAGAWRGQIVYTLSNGDTTAREFDYDVKGHILDGKDVREIIVEDFETLMSQLRSMKDNVELELANLTQELKNTVEQNETNRQAFFDDLVNDIEQLQSNYQELLDTGVLQTNINTKLEALEEEYAPKLTEVTAQLAQTEQRLTRAFKYGELKLPDDFPKEVPFKVYKTREGYTHDFDFTPYEYSKKIYVSRNGRTDADGLTPETPTRNIANILTILSNVEEVNVSIVFLDKFFPLGFWIENPINFGRNIRLTSVHEEGTVFGNFPTQNFSTVEDGLFKMTRNSVGKVLLYNVKDVWGNPSEVLETPTLDECKQTPNSFYTDGMNVWVNAPSESLESANENIGVLYRINGPLRFNIESNTLFIDNVKFAREANKSRTYEGLRINGTNESMVIARDSYFNYGDRNGFETVNVGNVHLFDCQASYNLIDGFNYHGTGDELITEFNCYASDNGDETQGSANATTGHDGMTILRIGTIGERCYGPVLADVNGCYSYNVGCAMYDSMNPGSFAFFFSETGAETPGAYYLIDCDAENPDGIDVAQNGGSPIKTRNSRFNTTTSTTEFEYI